MSDPYPILLLGATGQVGRALQPLLGMLGDVVACSRDRVDLLQPARLRDVIRDVAPRLIVNAAAYTDVDKAEDEPQQARLVNAEAPALLAAEAHRCDALLVHYSTDYVFDGRSADAYVETDATAPLSVYGASKRDGDENIIATARRYLIFRCSWLYASRGHNFPHTILRHALRHERLRVVDDQIGAPTSADLVAAVTLCALYRLRLDRDGGTAYHGLYHVAARGATSWCGLTRYLVAMARARNWPLRVDADAVDAIASVDYPTKACRPASSRLDCRKLENFLSLIMPSWQSGIDHWLNSVPPPQ